MISTTKAKPKLYNIITAVSTCSKGTPQQQSVVGLRELGGGESRIGQGISEFKKRGGLENWNESVKRAQDRKVVAAGGRWEHEPTTCCE